MRVGAGLFLLAITTSCGQAWRGTPAWLKAVPAHPTFTAHPRLPSLPVSRRCSITDFHAVGDNHTEDTAAIQVRLYSVID